AAKPGAFHEQSFTGGLTGRRPARRNAAPGSSTGSAHLSASSSGNSNRMFSLTEYTNTPTPTINPTSGWITLNSSPRTTGITTSVATQKMITSFTATMNNPTNSSRNSKRQAMSPSLCGNVFAEWEWKSTNVVAVG